RGDQLIRRGRRVGRHGAAEAGEVDGPYARATLAAAAGGGRRGVRFPRRPSAAGSLLDAAGRARVELSPRARAAPSMAALRALQPPFHRRLRRPVPAPASPGTPLTSLPRCPRRRPVP